MVYRRIYDLRDWYDLSQKELGEKINITQRAYSYYENGDRMIPPEVLIKLALFYNTSVDYLLELCDEQELTYTRSSKYKNLIQFRVENP